MADSNENIVHITAIDGLCTLIVEEIEHLKLKVESQKYEIDSARKGLNFWRTHELHNLRRAFE